MCTFPTAPPPLAFFWPGQTKYWLAFGLGFALYIAFFLLNSRGRLFRPVPGRPRELVVRCFFTGCTLGLAGAAPLCAAAFPSWDAIIAWRTTQLPWAITHGCVHDLDATVSHLSSSSRTLANLSTGVMVVGLLIAGAGPFAVTSFQRIRRGEGMPRQRPQWMERPWIDVILVCGITGLAAALAAAAVQARWVTIPLVLIASCVLAALLVRHWNRGPLRGAIPSHLLEQRVAIGIGNLFASVAGGGMFGYVVVQLGLTIANPPCLCLDARRGVYAGLELAIVDGVSTAVLAWCLLALLISFRLLFDRLGPDSHAYRWRRDQLIAFALSLLGCTALALLVLSVFDPALPDHLGAAFAHPRLSLLLRTGFLLLFIPFLLLAAGCLASQLLDRRHGRAQRVCAALGSLFIVPMAVVMCVGPADAALSNAWLGVFAFFAVACAVLSLTFFAWSLWAPRLLAPINSDRPVWMIGAARAIGAALLVVPLAPPLAAIAVLTQTGGSADINRSAPAFYLDYLGFGAAIAALLLTRMRHRTAASGAHEEPQ